MSTPPVFRALKAAQSLNEEIDILEPPSPGADTPTRRLYTQFSKEMDRLRHTALPWEGSAAEHEALDNARQRSRPRSASERLARQGPRARSTPVATQEEDDDAEPRVNSGEEDDDGEPQPYARSSRAELEEGDKDGEVDEEQAPPREDSPEVDFEISGHGAALVAEPPRKAQARLTIPTRHSQYSRAYRRSKIA